MMETLSSVSTCSPKEPNTAWRQDAVKLVEELLGVVSSESYDILLDFRQQLRSGHDWAATLDLFLLCRRHLELEHYLPMYRLRQLLSHWLQLQGAGEEAPHLRSLLRLKYRSLDEIRGAMQRERFEHSLRHEGSAPSDLKVVEVSAV